MKKCKDMLKRIDCLDVSLGKLSVIAFTLLLAKLWSPILGLTWQMYLAIAIIAAARPIYRTSLK